MWFNFITSVLFFFAEDLSGIFVKSVIEGSAADLNGQIVVNDQIVAVSWQSIDVNHPAVLIFYQFPLFKVDGVPLSGFTNQQAVEILKKTGAVVKLSVVRFLRGLKFEELQDGIDQADVVTPSSPPPPSHNTETSLAIANISEVKVRFRYNIHIQFLLWNTQIRRQ